ncbi:hypothetical protein K5D38_04870 [Pseudomonas cichorii]|nr:hypothetical protein [Pseudomonas cichorii]MBX8474104.1 hypothetical protein [Pseudomonas cichorii]GFM49012.1 hypothetical protein PSCICE_02790 [Pseudomonas cichorii]
MSPKPSNKLISEQCDMTEAEVGTYLTELQQQHDGSWLAYFAAEIGRRPELCANLSPERTLLIPEWLARHWFDRDKE